MDELIKQLQDLEEREFMVQMADHLDSSDYRYLDELHNRKIALKRELKEKYDYIA